MFRFNLLTRIVGEVRWIERKCFQGIIGGNLDIFRRLEDHVGGIVKGQTKVAFILLVRIFRLNAIIYREMYETEQQSRRKIPYANIEIVKYWVVRKVSFVS